MKVLVTGGSGFLGSWVAETLTERGHDVRALVRRSSNTTFLQTLPRVELAYGSVEDAPSVEAAMKGGIDAVVHAAGLVKAKSQAEFHEVNVQGTVNLLDAASKHAKGLKRFVHVSSLEASGPSHDGTPPPREQEEPCTAYGRSKLASERAVAGRKDELPVVIFRPAAIYGPRDQEILEAFKSIQRGLMPTIAGGTAKGSFIYGADCADVCVRAIDKDVPSGSVYFIDDGEIRTQRAFLELIEDALGKRALVRVNLPKGLLKTVSFGVQAFGKATNKAVMLTPEKANMLLRDFVCESSATRRDFDWAPKVKLADGLRTTAKWYREHGWL